MKRYVIPMILFATSLPADTILVPDDYPSIQDAIGASQDGDTVLVSPGVYGGPISFGGRNIVVKSTSGPGSTRIQTFPWYSCVYFTGGEDTTAVLEGFTVQNQINYGADQSDNQDIVEKGGGIYIYESSPIIVDCTIDGCVAGMGGGIYMDYTSAIVRNCTVSNNELHAYLYRGAGIFAGRSWNGVPPTIINCDIHSNRYASYGGGIQVEASFVRIINNSIHHNESAGINVWGSGPEIRSNYIAGNEGGSGIRISSGTAVIIGNMIVENSAGHGGGISEYSNSAITIGNNTISNNTASVRGGGIHTKNDSIAIINNIIWDNYAPLGSQIYLLAFADPTQTYIEFSNVMYGEDSVYIDSYATLTWGPGNIDVDPLFETGPICDYHLSMGSPCIDAGNPAPEYNDPEDPLNPGYALWPAMGYLRNDMGAFGGGGVGYWLSADEEQEEGPPFQGTFSLGLFPNPFSSSCTVCFKLDEPSHVDLSVYDLSGRLVDVVSDEYVPSGMHSRHMDGSGFSSGVYLIRLTAGGVSESRRCVVVR